MTTIDMNATLAELVTANPALAAHLDRAGLDYCCGGQRRLVDAVTTAGLDVNEVLRALASVSYHALYTALVELEADTHLHVHKENNVLFPTVERIERELAP